MMAYCAHVISRFSRQLIERSFDQDDVALFILMARDYLDEGGPLRELGHFLAHPKERDRGLVFKALELSAKRFEEYMEADRLNPGEQAPCIDFHPIDKKLLLADVRLVFAQAGLPGEIEIPPLAVEELIACVILIIQKCGLLINGQRAWFELRYGHGLHLSALYPSKLRQSYRALFPLLSVGNINRRYTGLDGEIEGYVARRNKTGLLVGVQYSVDWVCTGPYDALPDETPVLLLTP